LPKHVLFGIISTHKEGVNMDNKVMLTKKEVNDLRDYTKEVGHGSDGRVFPYKKKYLIKLYRKSLTLDSMAEVDKSGPYKDDDVKLYVMKKNRTSREEQEFNKIKKTNKQFITYYRKDDDNPEHDTKLASSEAITAAIKRQSDIKRTKLPLASVYYNNKFIGCIIEKLNGVGIHKLMWLPMNMKIKIINSVIDDLEELINHYVYHRDISNSPYASVGYIDEDGKSVHETGHSHVLVNPITLKTNIIDLDGKSTIYTERENEQLKQDSIRELLVLVIEYLLSVSLVDYVPNEYDTDYVYLNKIMEQYGYDKYDVDDFVYNLFNTTKNIEDVRNLVKKISTK